jgi:2-aminoadipate transaminase
MNHGCPDARWNDRLAQRTKRLKSSIIRELLKLTERPEIISFAGGLPAAEVFPTREIAAATQRLLDTRGSSALQYGASEGYLPLRELIVERMRRYGIEVSPANVLITCGSQQALDLIGRLLINPGDRVLVERPTYMGALQAFNAYQPEWISVPIDDDGVSLDDFEAALRSGPKFLYLLPNFQNPGGVTMSGERRRRVVELANHYGVPILEDDPYGQLRYRGEHLPPLVKIDAEMHDCDHGQHAFTGNVLYLSTLSKVLAPGLRIGWVVAPEDVIGKLVQIKQGADLHTGTFAQMVAHETAKDGFLDRHVHHIREVYGERLVAMLAAMERYFPRGVRWTRPDGGLFLWVTLPLGLNTSALLQEALARDVAFVPGAPFHADGGGENTMRLNFSFCSPERAEEGIARLGALLKEHISPNTSAETAREAPVSR